MIASVHIKPALIVYKGKEERLSYKKRSSQEASGVTLGDSSLCLFRRRFPRYLPDYEISEEDLCRDVMHVGYLFTSSKARGGTVSPCSYCCRCRSGGRRWSGRGSRLPGVGGRHWGRWRCRCHRWPARTAWGWGRGRCGTWRSGRCRSGRSHRCGYPGTPRWSRTLWGKASVKKPVLDFDWTLSGELTFAVSLVHDLQVRVSHAAGHQQGALVLVRLPVTAAHGVLPRNVRAVWGAHALGPPHLHFADLPRAAFDSLACVWKSRASVSVGVVLLD